MKIKIGRTKEEKLEEEGEIVWIPIEKIKLPQSYTETGLKPLKWRVEKIERALEEGKEIAPIELLPIEQLPGYYEIYDGVHRYTAYVNMGYKRVPAIIRW